MTGVFWIDIWFYRTLTLVTTNNYDSLSELHAQKFTVTTAHIKTSQSSPAVAWQRLPKAEIPLPPGSRILPGFSYQLLTFHFSLLTTSIFNRLNSLSSKLLLVLASTVILGSESCGTHDHILLSHVCGSRATELLLLVI
jgi:hypothetical protein